MRADASPPLVGVLYDRRDWVQPVLDVLERRGVPAEPVHATDIVFDPEERGPRHAVVLNRVSAHPTADDPSIVFFVLRYLAHLESIGANVINGYPAFSVALSKVRQLRLMRQLGLEVPATRVIGDPARAPRAAAALRFPVLWKPNVGGSGAGISRFEGPADMRQAVEENALALGPDRTGLLQEMIPVRDDCIYRVEMIGDEVLYATRQRIRDGAFNYCAISGESVRASGADVELYEPQDGVLRDVRAILSAAACDLGAVEYVVDDRDGVIRYYDINPYSNFLKDAGERGAVDPVEKLVDLVVSRCR